MTNVVVIGSGAVAAELCSYILDINNSGADNIHIMGFLDIDKDLFEKNKAKYRFTHPYLGTYDDFDFNIEAKFVLAFANIEGRLNFISRVDQKRISFLTVIHPSCIVADSAIIGVGNIIYPNCIIGPGAIVGNHNLITSYSFISHDCEVGNNNFLSTSGISGNVKLGSNNYFGIRATVIPDINIGSNNLIQSGMVICNDISNNETVFYKYKESIRIISEK